MKPIATLGAIIAMALSLQACGVLDKQAQYKVAGRELAADMAAVTAADPDHIPTISPDTAAKGEAGQFARTFKGFLIKVLADRMGYRKEMDSLQLSEIAKPEALAAPGGLARARAAIAQGQLAVKKYRALNDQRLAEIRRDMATVAPGSDVVKSFEKGLNESLGGQGGSVGQMFDMEGQILDEYAAALDGLDQARGRWRAVGGNIMFSRVSDMEAFNTHMRNIQSINSREQALILAERMKATRQIGEMNSATTD